MLTTLILPFTLLLNFFACDVPTSSSEEDEITSFTFVEGYEFPYNFKEPIVSHVLADELLEISGLTLVKNETKIAAVQDEQGVVFILNKTTGKIEKEIPFHAKGDYEGLEMVGKDLFVVKSKGDIYQIRNLGADDQKVKIHETFLNKTANVEGLGYDAATNQLLLACKGQFAKGGEKSFSRAIYGFDLKTKKLIEKPIVNIDLNQITGYLESGPSVKYLEKLMEKLHPEKGFIFGPSGIAIHPKTKNIYVISSVGKMLMVLSPEGKIIHIEKFKKKIHPQPEGIVFEKDGSLWISNEANESRPTLVKYSM